MGRITRAPSHRIGSTQSAITNIHARSGRCSTCARATDSAATSATVASNSQVSLARRLTAAPSGDGPQVETLHAPIQRLARQPEGLGGAADVASRFSQAGFYHLLARRIGVAVAARRLALR